MQIIKSITGQTDFKDLPGNQERTLGERFWSDGGYIGTVGEGITAEIIRDYIEKQGMPKKRRI